MQHGRRLAVGDVGYQRGQVIVTRSMGCCIDADSKSIAAETFSGVAARTMRQCGHQVREFKSQFRLRGFGTVYQLWYKSTCGLGTAEPGAASILKV